MPVAPIGRGLAFSDLVGAVGIPRFLGEYWSKSHLHLKGAVTRVAKQFGWADLNDLLSRQRLPFPRIRMMKNGVLVRPESYTQRRPGRRDQVSAEHVNMGMLTFHLKDGATLIVNAVDEMHDGLAELCRDMSQAIGEHVSANIYCTFGNDPGFPPHWDDHEVIILQLTGSKHWRVFQPTREHPLIDDVEGNLVCPDDPILDVELEAGDVVYLPRGYWHNVVPNGRPSLHITFGISPPTAIDWARDILDDTIKHTLMRTNVPVFGDPASRSAFERDVKALLAIAIEGASLDHYLERRRSRLKPLVPASLPEAILAAELTADTELRFTGIGFGAVKTDPTVDTVTVTALDREWSFDVAFSGALDRLLSGEPVRLGEIHSSVEADRDDVDAFIVQLLYDGFLAVVPGNPSLAGAETSEPVVTETV